MGTTTRLLAVMGSGETSPTMVTLHKELVARLRGRIEAVLLETPYGFQENADDISAKAVRYFRASVGLAVTPAPGLRAPADVPDGAERGLAAVRTADWLFAGPGSPTYALDQWRRSAVAGALADRLGAAGGVTVFSSAAACALGAFALPVYGVYKVGMPPEWRPGLDLLGAAGLTVALVPHYDNAEGGTHDTRFCYLGERRLAVIEQELPPDAAVLGVDEHTALVLDLLAGTASVHGRGVVTVRRRGRSERVPAGVRLQIAELRALVRGASATSVPSTSTAVGTSAAGVPDEATAGAGSAAAGAAAGPGAAGETGSLGEATRSCEQAFEAAAAADDVSAMVQAVLDLEAAVAAWSADTLQSDEADRARQVLRSLVVRLGQTAEGAVRDPRRLLAPLVEGLLALRARLRGERAFELADAVRDTLVVGAVEVRDTPDGTEWSVSERRLR